MEVGEELNFKLQRWIGSVSKRQSFTIGAQATSLFEVGSELKLVGFADGKTGQTAFDSETIKIVDEPLEKLVFEKSYYILAEDGLEVDLKKTTKCDPKDRMPLDEDDRSRLSCKLLARSRLEFIADLPDCRVDQGLLSPGQTYFIELEWTPRDRQSEHFIEVQSEVHHIRLTTQKTKTICHFEEGDSILVNSKVANTLKPVIQGQSSLIART